MAYTTIDKPSDYFDTKLYTATASDLSITGLDFAPNWIWIKSRNLTGDHSIFDSVRGTGKQLQSNTTGAEFTTADALSAFNSDGFSITGTGNNYTNRDGRTYVAWNWKAAGSASTNSQGATNSSVSVNTDAGFSIASATTSTSSGNTTTIGHGLGVSPDMIIWKARNASGSWGVAHKSLGITSGYLSLNGTGAFVTEAGHIDGVSSTLITLGQYIPNASNIFYSFAEKQGYSKFGSYVGNGSSSGTYVHLGFKPAFVITKRTDGVANWSLKDNKRETGNPVSNLVWVSASDAESDNYILDFLSNGFKIRDSSAGVNGSGNTYIYMAFAENPFVSSSGVPACAR